MSWISWCLVQDLCLNFITGQFDESMGCWVVTSAAISRRYTRSWLLIDIISIIPFDVIGVLEDSNGVSKLKVLRVVRLLRLVKLVRILKGSRCEGVLSRVRPLSVAGGIERVYLALSESSRAGSTGWASPTASSRW